jgi:glycosyltransferase involved in cell wall biosynthesis
MYKVSLIVPIYGVERYIRQFAESALGQTYADMQFVFVNDGTKDRSMEILQELIEEKYSSL